MSVINKTKRLAKIIKPLASAKYQVDIPWRYLEESLERYSKEYGGLDVNPDFQRGHVWLPEQQQHFIENVLRGIVSSSQLVIQWNCPSWDDYYYKGPMFIGFQCIDGLQRLTAVRRFLKGEVKPFGLSVDDLIGSRFAPTFSNYTFKFAVHNLANRKDLLSHYLDLNAGGTQHTDNEIDRVRELLEKAN